MTDLPNPDSLKPAPYGGSWRMRLAVGLLILLAIGVVLVTNRWLSERFTETTRNRAELRLALYSGNMLSEVQRTSVVPLLLADDPAIRDALLKNSFADTTLRLIKVQGEIGVASILLLDGDGRVWIVDWDETVLAPRERALLHERIAVRFDTMLAGGLIEELRTLRTTFPQLTPDATSMR